MIYDCPNCAKGVGIPQPPEAGRLYECDHCTFQWDSCSWESRRWNDTINYQNWERSTKAARRSAHEFKAKIGKDV